MSIMTMEIAQQHALDCQNGKCCMREPGVPPPCPRMKLNTDKNGREVLSPITKNCVGVTADDWMRVVPLDKEQK